MEFVDFLNQFDFSGFDQYASGATRFVVAAASLFFSLGFCFKLGVGTFKTVTAKPQLMANLSLGLLFILGITAIGYAIGGFGSAIGASGAASALTSVVTLLATNEPPKHW